MTKKQLEEKIEQLEKRLLAIEGHVYMTPIQTPLVIERIRRCKWCHEEFPCGRTHIIC